MARVNEVISEVS